MRSRLLSRSFSILFFLVMLVDQAVSQNENFELTKADSLAYNDSTSTVDFETYLANLKIC